MDQRNRKVTNHDVKAVEYFIKDAFEKLGCLNTKSSSILDWLLRTSIQQFLSTKEAFEKVYMPSYYFDF
jgi:adenylosuccinate lyase